MKNLSKYVPDLSDMLLCAGAAAVAYGCAIAWTPAGWIVAGAFCILAGLKLE